MVCELYLHCLESRGVVKTDSETVLKLKVGGPALPPPGRGTRSRPPDPWFFQGQARRPARGVSPWARRAGADFLSPLPSLLREQWIRAKYERQEFTDPQKQEPYSAGKAGATPTLRPSVPRLRLCPPPRAAEPSGTWVTACQAPGPADEWGGLVLTPEPRRRGAWGPSGLRVQLGSCEASGCRRGGCGRASGPRCGARRAHWRGHAVLPVP